MNRTKTHSNKVWIFSEIELSVCSCMCTKHPHHTQVSGVEGLHGKVMWRERQHVTTQDLSHGLKLLSYSRVCLPQTGSFFTFTSFSLGLWLGAVSLVSSTNVVRSLQELNRCPCDTLAYTDCPQQPINNSCSTSSYRYKSATVSSSCGVEGMQEICERLCEFSSSTCH